MTTVLTGARICALKKASPHASISSARFCVGSLGFLLSLLGVIPQGQAQTVSVVQTNADMSALLQPEPSLTFESKASGPLAIHVDDDVRYQEMDGFGASFTDSSAWLVWTKLAPSQRDTLLRNLFTSEGAALSFLRQPMGATDLALSDYTYDDMPAGQTDPQMAHFSIDHDRPYVLPVVRAALALNPKITVMALPWSPPAWMKTNLALHGGGFNPQYYGALALYFRRFMEEYNASGVPIHLLAVQNEPLFAGDGYPTEFLTAPQEAQFISQYLGPMLDKDDSRRDDGLETKILGYEHNWDAPYYPEILLRSPAARYLAGVSFHCYAGNQDVAQGAIREFFPEKGIWFTECTGITTAPNFGSNLGWNMHNLLIGAVRGGAKSVVLWNMALDQNSGPTNGNGCKTCRGVVTVDTSSSPAVVRYEVEYYALGQASKFVVPGAHRVDSNIAGPVESVAFKNPDGSIALLAYNSASSSQTFDVNWQGNAFTYTLPAGSVATFKWNTVSPPDFALALSPASQTVAAGRSTEFDIALRRYGQDFDDDIDISVTGVPPGVDTEVGQQKLRVSVSSAAAPGTYPLTLTGTADGKTDSATVQLVVGPAAAPFLGTPWTIPGRIEAENFDIGGEGIAYHDIDLFPDIEGGTYRPGEAVDLESTTDVGGGFDVGFTQPGGWMRYSVNVQNSGLYAVGARVAFLGQGGAFHVDIDDPAERVFDEDSGERWHEGRLHRRDTTTGVMVVPNTGWYQNWTTIRSPILRLSEGPHTLKLVFDSQNSSGGMGNFNWLSVDPAGPGLSTPFHDSPAAIPGTIQAEDFDNGGQNVAYYDQAPNNQGGQYRPSERIGIESTTDLGGGFDVGWTSNGEWLNYTVSITEGTYTLHVRVASLPPGGTFHLALDGHDISGDLTLPSTGGWQNWETIDVPGVHLPGGVHVLQLVMDGPGYWGAIGNFNWISFD
jgi:glucosylceramidase